MDRGDKFKTASGRDQRMGACGKRVYSSRLKARRANQTMHNKFRIYYHVTCDGWHVTNAESDNPAIKGARKSRRRIRWARQRQREDL